MQNNDKSETSPSTESSLKESTATAACPNKHFQLKRLPTKANRRHGLLTEMAKQLAKLAIDNGNDNTFLLAMARMQQAKSEVEELISNSKNMSELSVTEEEQSEKIVPLPPQMPLKNSKQKAQAARVNNSNLGK